MVDDVIHGITQAMGVDEYKLKAPIVERKLLKVYTCLDEFTTLSISELLGISMRQARRYMKAVKVCNIFIQNIVDRVPISEVACTTWEVTYSPKTNNDEELTTDGVRNPHES